MPKLRKALCPKDVIRVETVFESDYNSRHATAVKFGKGILSNGKNINTFSVYKLNNCKFYKKSLSFKLPKDCLSSFEENNTLVFDNGLIGTYSPEEIKATKDNCITIKVEFNLEDSDLINNVEYFTILEYKSFEWELITKMINIFKQAYNERYYKVPNVEIDMVLSDTYNEIKSVKQTDVFSNIFTMKWINKESDDHVDIVMYDDDCLYYNTICFENGEIVTYNPEDIKIAFNVGFILPIKVNANKLSPNIRFAFVKKS